MSVVAAVLPVVSPLKVLRWAVPVAVALVLLPSVLDRAFSGEL